MQFAAARLPRFLGPRSSWADRSSRRVSRAVAGPPTDWGCKAAIQGAAAHHESGGATRAAPLAMRAHRGTGSSNPLPSSREMLWGRRRRNGTIVAAFKLMERLMPQPNDLSRSLVALDQNSTIIAVV